MRYSIHQVSDTTWELRAEDGTVVATYTDRPGNTGYDQACTRLGALLAEDRTTRLAAGDPIESVDGLLPERWISDAGIAFSRETAGGRDFSATEWSWRDPANSLVPLMLDVTSQGGHMGAELAGFVEEFHMDGTTPQASGRFYDTEIGQQFRDLLLDGRRFGVSVDPSENVVAEYEESCVELSDDGLCAEWDFSVVFRAYEIGGLTGTPFPCFEEASIVLDGSGSASVAPVRASVTVPTRPPRAWMTLAEPRPGHDFLDDQIGDDVLVPQHDRAGVQVGLACPLTIRDDGLVYGHLTTWGRCHIGDPWGPGVCASAAPSANGYADFLTGSTSCDDGSNVPTGVLTVGCEHSYAFDAPGVRDHLAHAGMGWADVHVTNGDYGPWLSGVLRPGITDTQLRVLRSLSLSGEWVGELAGILSVNVPGLPVQRALAASAFPQQSIPLGVLKASARAGGLTSLVGANIVRPCPDCAQRRLSGQDGPALNQVLRRLDQLGRVVGKVELRTRHLVPAEAEAARARLNP